MIRLHLIVEGQTEETFVKDVLAKHFGNRNIAVDCHKVTTGKTRYRIFRGGGNSYQLWKRDLDLWIKQDSASDSYFSTMVDLYGLPRDFPRYYESKALRDPNQRVHALEEAFRKDIDHHRFILYIQLHEFEALILSDPNQLIHQFPEKSNCIRMLADIVNRYPSPELIDDGATTFPSKRIIDQIPEYEKRKSSAGPIVAGKISFQMMRMKCPHFDGWITKLENLPNG